MDWKNEKPTEPGRYFYKDNKNDHHFNIWSCSVVTHNGTLEAHGSGMRKVRDMPGWWYGPIKLPDETWINM